MMYSMETCEYFRNIEYIIKENAFGSVSPFLK